LRLDSPLSFKSKEKMIAKKDSPARLRDSIGSEVIMPYITAYSQKGRSGEMSCRHYKLNLVNELVIPLITHSGSRIKGLIYNAKWLGEPNKT